MTIPPNDAKIIFAGNPGEDTWVERAFRDGNDPLTINDRQHENRLHRAGRRDIVHYWIEEASTIDERVFDLLGHKAADQIRAQVKANWEAEHGIQEKPNLWTRPRTEGGPQG